MEPNSETKERPASAERFSAGKLRGVMIPFTTPFGVDDEIDLRALKSNIESWNSAGIAGYIALGSTGERVHLSERECLNVIEAARAAIPAHLSLVVGTGQQSTRLTIEEMKRWAVAGADALLLITPSYYRAEMTQGALLSYYREAADSSSVPVVLYNIPQLTGITLAPETVAALAEHENICGIKDSSGDMVALGEMLRLVPEDFSVLTGHGSALLAALSLGAAGAILAVGCFATRACVEVYDAFHAGDYERARAVQRKLAQLVRTVMGRYGIGGIKTAMSALGLEGTRTRLPLSMPDEGARLEIARHLGESGLFDEEMKAIASSVR